MGVMPGYKQTDVGVIPGDWDVKSLADLGTFKNGINKAKEDFGHGSPFINLMDVFGIPKVSRLATDFGLVNSTAAERKLYELKSGDVLFVRSSVKPAGVGLTTLIPEDLPETVFSGFLIRFRDGGLLDRDFKEHCFWDEGFRSRLLSNSTISANTNINQDALKRLQIAIPPRQSEQRAIAEALSDVDALLSGLDRLIAKKRDLRQAAMQQLLTGQIRLPGFSGEWDSSTLKDVAEICTGINKPISEMGQGALYVTVQDLYDGTSIRTDCLGRIRVSTAEMQAKSLEPGDVVFGKSSVKREGIGYPSLFLGCAEPVVLSGFTYSARARPRVADPAYLFYALRSSKTRRWLIDNSQASALTNINQRIADAIPVMLPPHAEQAAIGAVLVDMDAELAGLNQRRDKTRALKQAMMQELLTGRTRLI